MKTTFIVAVAFLACASLAYAETQPQGYHGGSKSKTVSVWTTYNSTNNGTTLTSSPITVAQINGAPWTKRSWNKHPKPSPLTTITSVMVMNYKAVTPLASAAVVNNGAAFTVTFNTNSTSQVVPVTVMYTGTTAMNTAVTGYVVVYPSTWYNGGGHNKGGHKG